MLGKLWRGWRSARDEAAVRRRAIPDDLWKRTLVRYPFLQRRDADAAAELRRLTSLFLDRKEFDCTGGLRLTDALAVSIAAQAALPVLRQGIERYDGFVGLVVPHLLRLAFGPDHRRLLPLSMLGGAALVLLCDLPTRFLPGGIRLGVMTALLGGPFLLWMLRRNPC